jgi:hypothetical protein
MSLVLIFIYNYYLMFKLMILIGTLFLIVFASKGFDFEYRIDYGEMICFRQSGYDFFVQRYDA